MNNDSDIPIWSTLIIFCILISVPLRAVAQQEIPLVPHVTVKIEQETIQLEQQVFSDYTVIEQYIADTFPEDPRTAIAIAWAESSLVECAHGDKVNTLAPKGSWGIMQINIAVHTDKLAGRDVCNWRDNIDIAREVYDERGSWEAWGAFSDKRYLGFYK